ncbi:FtsK/SpoIIIE domain-containing protein, partial [Georgenia sp. 10Sc9-8]|nr:FtsK/SpoIIIE domain-containing protein [Georgenia halotolerans]
MGAVRIKLTLLRAAADPADLLLTVADTTTVADVADGLRLTDPPAASAARRVTLRVHGAGSVAGVLPGHVRAAQVVRPGSVVSVVPDGTAAPAADRGPTVRTPTGGPVPFNRSPVPTPAFDGETVRAPRPPDPPRSTRFPLVLLLAPLVLAPILLVGGRNALSLVFLAMMPVMVLGTYLDQRLTGRRSHRAAAARFTRTLEAVRADLTDRQDQEREARVGAQPPTAELVAAALSLAPLLWSRRPDQPAFGELCLGTGTMPSGTTLELPERGAAPAELWEQLTRLRAGVTDVRDVPVTVGLRRVGCLGLAGSRPVLDAVCRTQVLRLVTLHSPAELVLVVLTSPGRQDRWDWAKWLPHVDPQHSPLPGTRLAADPAGQRGVLDGLEQLVAERESARRDRAPVPLVVVVVDDAVPGGRARLVQLAEEGPGAGVHVLWCAERVEELPAACRAFLRITGPPADGAQGLPADGAEGPPALLHDGAQVHPVVCETVGNATALTVARHLCAVVDAGATGRDTGLPQRVRYLALPGAEGASEPDRILRRWQETGSGAPGRTTPPRVRGHLRALVGTAGAAPFHLDLDTQGPHAMVGGTTGSGKSELLQAWVLGMATAHGPDRVTFLLVDYKGGSAFAGCVDLPHTVGLVTDLSAHLARRALTSLRAELEHRERLLARKGAADLVALELAGDTDTPPRLVVVVDEFATLATEMPQFLDGVVDVAQRGRSLGLHLILATQRPAGVITDNLRANTSLRVVLRTADENDSIDVLGLPVAAHVDLRTPGRGAARTGRGPAVLFQTGHVGGRATSGRPALRVETLGVGPSVRWEPRGDTPLLGPGGGAADSGSPGAPSSEEPTDLVRVVSAVRAAAGSASLPPPRRPWLPTLGPVQDLADLPRRTDAELVLGVVDDPARQRQVPYVFRPDVDGSIAVYGAGGSGKSTALRTLAVAAARTVGGGPVHVYGLDFSSGGLAALSDLPHVGAVIDGEDGERLERLVRRTHEQVSDRAARYAAAGAGTITEYRRVADRPDEARILLLLDGFAAFRSGWETDVGRALTYQRLLRLLVDGRAVGVHAAVTAERPGAIPTTVTGSVPRRVVLRQADEDAYTVLGVPRDVLAATSPPGR